MAELEGERLLEQRAAVLARPQDEAAERAVTEVVVVGVAGRRYAVETEHVRRVVRVAGMSLLPRSAGQLIGLLPVEGGAVPVADLAAVLGLSAAEPRRQFALVLGVDGPLVGVLVDEVVAAVSVPDASLVLAEPPSNNRRGLEIGVTEGGVVFLDAAALLAHDALNVSASASSPQAPSRGET